MLTKTVNRYVALLGLILSFSKSGANPREAECSTSLTRAVFPVAGSELGLGVTQQQRFEIRYCPGGQAHIQLLGFKRGSERPSIVVNTEAHLTALVIQTGSVLAVEVIDGVSSYGFYLLTFKQGSPIVVGQDRTVGNVSYSESHLEHPVRDLVNFVVPLKTYPGEPKKVPKTYHLNIAGE